jgi:hypothetical protein
VQRTHRMEMGPDTSHCLAPPAGAELHSLVVPKCLTCDGKQYWPSRFCSTCTRDYVSLRKQFTAEEVVTFDMDCWNIGFVVPRVIRFQEEQEEGMRQREEALLEAKTRAYERTADRPYNPTSSIRFWTDHDADLSLGPHQDRRHDGGGVSEESKPRGMSEYALAQHDIFGCPQEHISSRMSRCPVAPPQATGSGSTSTSMLHQ